MKTALLLWLSEMARDKSELEIWAAMWVSA
jgi:hypothetical protein